MNFGNEGINKIRFHKNKHLTNIFKVDIDRKVLLIKIHMVKSAFKHFIGYVTNGIKPLCIKLPQMDMSNTLIAVTSIRIF